jgi:hypothetical protein
MGSENKPSALAGEKAVREIGLQFLLHPPEPGIVIVRRMMETGKRGRLRGLGER